MVPQISFKSPKYLVTSTLRVSGVFWILHLVIISRKVSIVPVRTAVAQLDWPGIVLACRPELKSDLDLGQLLGIQNGEDSQGSGWN